MGVHLSLDQRAAVRCAYIMHGTVAGAAREVGVHYQAAWRAVDGARKSGELATMHQALASRVVPRLVDRLADANDTAASRLASDEWCSKFSGDPTAALVRGMADATRTLVLANDGNDANTARPAVTVLVQRVPLSAKKQ